MLGEDRMSKKGLALVTGASRGIGQTIAIALADSGYTVIAVSRLGTSENISGVHSLTCDVSDPNSVVALAKKVKTEYGTVTVLVNAAGVFGPVDLIHKTNMNDWAQTIMIDAISPYYLIHEFLPGMLENKWGRIISLSSAASLHPPGPLNSAYGTSKVALNQLTRHVASEIAGSGVTANVMHPGDVKTDMWKDIKEKSLALGELGAGYTAWVDWVDKTGGDDPNKAAKLVLDLVNIKSNEINGKFCWIENPLQSPIPSWEDLNEAQPWN